MRMRTLTRRKLLGGLLSSGMTGLLGNALAQPVSRQVLVIGAGLAGLSAARVLEQLGFSVQVIEARTRVGGRVYTLDNILGRPEAGGNGMGANYGRVLDTAEKLNVPMRRQLRGLPSDFYIDDTHLSADDWQHWSHNPLPSALKSVTPNRLWGHITGKPPFIGSADWRNPNYAKHDISAADFFRSKGLDDKAIALLNINNSYGNTLETTSMLSLYRVRANINRLISMGQPGLEASAGNMRIPEAMANSLSRPVVLGQQISHIDQSGNTVKAISTTGDTHHADAVILALPTTAVKRIHFTPLLSRAQNAAFSNLQYHKITQAHLIAQQPFWQEHGHKGSFWTNGPLGRIFSRQIPNTDRYNMTVWINGDECDAFDSLPVDLAQEKIMQSFVKTYPGANSANVELKQLVRWQSEQHNQGAWAVWQPGQISRFFQLTHQPVDRLFFAGEHTAYSSSGMEGAAESGERAALETVRRLL